MINKIIRIWIILWSMGTVFAQSTPELLVQPYLQDAEPDGITIMWETSEGEESIVEWGKTPKLGNKAKGTAFDINFSKSRIHKVRINGLDRFTEYYYRVKTGTTKSDIFQFKTPPFPSEGKSFNIVAMSDMQNDHNFPDKFSEMVNQGIIHYMATNYDKSLSENLAMVLVPGDLVENGSKYEQWQGDFFGPAEKLFAQVPVYPVLGNHERNSEFYFKYFSLPENGTPAYAEHWWYKDYGNARIIGLNSNQGYEDLKEQQEWLKDVLADAENNANIDFVFAQLHHPHKSELWIPGEKESTGRVVKLLEEFSTKTGKPSIHFFGHTHGYSRGQSKDHKHLWINVASAGGAIDNWGEFEGRDYDEFTVTQDEYGFVLIEVNDDPDDPKFTIKRISRGNLTKFRDNELRDSITVWKRNRKPKAPKTEGPIEGASVAIQGTIMTASKFQSEYPKTFHAASHWQVSENEKFDILVYESWKQHENWYYEANRQKDDDLSDESTNRLKSGKTYFWRVRYRDQNLNWSDWSNVASFKTN